MIEMLNNILTTCDIVQISVDNSLRNNTSKQRGLTPEQSETLINAIKGVSKCNFLTIVNITPTSMNQYEILNIIDEVVNLGINTLNLCGVTSRILSSFRSNREFWRVYERSGASLYLQFRCHQ